MYRLGDEAQLNRFAVVRYDVLDGQTASLLAKRGPGIIQEGTGDMDVRGVSSVPGAQSIRSLNGSSVPQSQPTRPQAPRDQLELSSAGKMLDQLSQNPDIRQERLARIKEAIANGTYDTDEKLEAALSRMFDAVNREVDHD